MSSTRRRLATSSGPGWSAAADGNATEVYLTHSGVEEVAVGGSCASSSNTYIWQRRPSDPELEAEMLNRLTVYLGASEKRAEAQQAKAGAAAGPRVRLVEQGGESQLIVGEDYSRAWRLVGLALDSSNYAVEEQNRSQGLYVVEYRDPEQENRKPGDEGWFSKLAFWRSKPEAPPPGTRYRVRLAGQGAQQTVVVVRDASDQPDRSAGARQVLDALQRDHQVVLRPGIGVSPESRRITSFGRNVQGERAHPAVAAATGQPDRRWRGGRTPGLGGQGTAGKQPGRRRHPHHRRSGAGRRPADPGA